MKKIISLIYRLSVYAKLTFLIFVTVSFLGISAIVVTHYNASKETDKVIFELLESMIRSNENLIIEFILTDNSWQLYKYLSSIVEKTDFVAYAGFITKDNRVFAHTDTHRYHTGDLFLNEDRKGYIIPFETNNLPLGYFILRVKKETFIQKIEGMFFANIAFVFLSALLSFVIANLFMRKLLGRLDVVRANAKAIAQRQWDRIVSFETPYNDEITELIHTTESLMYDIKHSIEATEEQKNFYHTVLKSIDSFIVIIDESMELIYHNNHAFAKCILNEENNHFNQRFHQQIVSALEAQSVSFFTPLYCTSYNHQKEHSILVTIHRIKTMIVILFSDATAIKQESENEKVINSLQVMAEISSLFAHEIKNLIQPLKLLLPKDEVPDKEDIAMANVTIDKIDNQIMDYLLLRKPIEQKAEKAFIIKPLVDECAKIFKKAMKEKDLVLEQKIDPSAEVFISKESLETILVNLFKNAIEASFLHEKILIEWENSSEKIGILKIQNSCENVPLELRKNFFKPFFTTKKEGSGLGLFTVYRTVYLLGGHIHVHHSDQAIMFEIHLPRKKLL